VVRGTDGRPLSALLKRNMGAVVINICSMVEYAPSTRWSDLRFNAGSTTNLSDRGRVNYGLPYAADQTPPAGSVMAGSASGQSGLNRAPRPCVDLSLTEPLPDGLSVKPSRHGWTVANTHDIQKLVRANSRLFDGIHAMVDAINATGPEHAHGSHGTGPLKVQTALSAPDIVERTRRRVSTP
jgi:hypothetical protein